MRETMTMSELQEQDGTELYYLLLNKRVVNWERAETRSRAEHEQAEAFTRAWAEMDAALKDGGVLPRAWARAKPSIGLEPIPASDMPRVITDDIALNMAAAVLESMNRHSLAYELRSLLPDAEGRVHGQQYQEKTGKWGSGTDAETGITWPDEAILKTMGDRSD
jgi:hypothetical protein